MTVDAQRAPGASSPGRVVASAAAVAPAPRVTPARIGGADVDGALRVFEAGYHGEGLRSGVAPDGFSWQHSVIGDGPVTLRSCRFGAGLSGVVEPPDAYVVTWFSSGAGVLDVGRDELALTAQTPFVFPTGRPFGFEYSAFRQNLLNIDADWLERFAAARDGHERRPLVLRHDTVLDDGQRARWRRVTELVAAAFLAPQAAPPLSLAEVSGLVAETVLDVYVEPFAPAPASAVPVSRARVDAALDYVQHHAHLPITAIEIAEAVGVSARVRQSAFQSDLGRTPTAHLRAVRLQRARDELVAAVRDAGGAGQGVGDVARRWGFAHLGRFSADYAKSFGELPSQTLHRSA